MDVEECERGAPDGYPAFPRYVHERVRVSSVCSLEIEASVLQALRNRRCSASVRAADREPGEMRKKKLTDMQVAWSPRPRRILTRRPGASPRRELRFHSRGSRDSVARKKSSCFCVHGSSPGPFPDALADTNLDELRSKPKKICIQKWKNFSSIRPKNKYTAKIHYKLNISIH